MQMQHRVWPIGVAQIAVGVQVQPCAESPPRRKSQCTPKNPCGASARNFAFPASQLPLYGDHHPFSPAHSLEFEILHLPGIVNCCYQLLAESRHDRDHRVFEDAGRDPNSRVKIFGCPRDSNPDSPASRVNPLTPDTSETSDTSPVAAQENH